MTEYIILSLKHTNDYEHVVTFWRPNDAGYTYFVEDAGRYDANRVKEFYSYYNNDDTLAIPVDVVVTLAQQYEKGTGVMNTPRNLKIMKGAAYRRGEVSC